MPFMQQLDQVLGPWDPGKTLHIYSSMGRMTEPVPCSSKVEDSAGGRGTLGHQCQVPPCFQAEASPGSRGNPDHHLPHQLWQYTPSEEYWPGMAQAVSSSSFSLRSQYPLPGTFMEPIMGTHPWEDAQHGKNNYCCWTCPILGWVHLLEIPFHPHTDCFPGMGNG